MRTLCVWFPEWPLMVLDGTGPGYVYEEGHAAGGDAAILEGVAAVYAEVPAGVGEHELRRLAALTRARKAGLALRPLRGQLPAGITHLRINGRGVSWEGADQGHGRLLERRLALEVSGKSLPWQAFDLGA